MLPSEEKWLAMPVEKKADVIANIEKMLGLESKKIELMGQLRECLVHHWMRHFLGERRDLGEKYLYGLATTYYRALFDGRDRICYRDVAMSTDTAKLAIEWIANYEKKLADRTSTYRGMSNPVTAHLRMIERDYERKPKLREEQNDGKQSGSVCGDRGLSPSGALVRERDPDT